MNVVIGVLVVLCELHVVSLVVDAVVGLTLGLIAHVVVVVFVVAILQRIFCIWRYTLYTHQTTKSESGTLAHSVVSAHDEEVDAYSSSSSSSQRTKRRGQGPSTDAMPPTRLQ